MEKIKVGVFIFDDADLMDIAGPVEVFNAVRIVNDGEQSSDEISQLYNSQSLFELDYISFEPKDSITTADGTRIIPDLAFSDIQDLEKYQVWVVPGGKGIHRIRKTEKFIKMIENAIDESFITLSVCTGAYAVAETGYLDNELVTTHWRHLDLFQKEFPQVRLANNARYCSGHKVVTTGGVTAGFDGALHIVRNMISDDAATKAAELINYPWLE